MAKRTTHQDQTGHYFRLGRNRPVARGPRLSLKNYLMRGVPAPPASVDYSKKAAKALAQMYLNNQLGDCVIAGMAHLVGVFTGNAGDPLAVYSSNQIIALYSAIGGYVPGHPNTDHGCDEQTALNYWQQHGAPTQSGAHEIAGWISVDGNDETEYRTALWLFENLYFGLELPNAWINPFPSAPGFVWNVAGPPIPTNGHCVVGVGYTPKGVTICTWGMMGLMTDGAIAKYATTVGAGELYTVVSHDALEKATEKAPNGFDWSQLVADFDSMGGNVSPSSVARAVRRRRK
ncbi:MAG TPA: hypothetical protein VEK75_13050 [Xanthobacteraceae bacterium]|nr:hypothetical protein [Xanthobacteraceae bacterium]